MLETLSWIGTSITFAGAMFVAHGKHQRVGYILFLIGALGLLPILWVDTHVRSQFWLQISFAAINIFGLLRRRRTDSGAL